MEVSIVPIRLRSESASLSDVVAKFFDFLNENERVKVEIYPTSTVIYGELEDIFNALRFAIEKTVSLEEIPRIVSFIKLDVRIDKDATPQTKYDSVIKKISK